MVNKTQKGCSNQVDQNPDHVPEESQSGGDFTFLCLNRFLHKVHYSCVRPFPISADFDGREGVPNLSKNCKTLRCTRHLNLGNRINIFDV